MRVGEWLGFVDWKSHLSVPSVILADEIELLRGISKLAEGHFLNGVTVGLKEVSTLIDDSKLDLRIFHQLQQESDIKPTSPPISSWTVSKWDRPGLEECYLLVNIADAHMTAFPVMGIIEPDNSALMVRHPDTKAVPVGGTLTIHTKIVEVLAMALSGGASWTIARRWWDPL